jgi:hypothetical protein
MKLVIVVLALVISIAVLAKFATGRPVVSTAPTTMEDTFERAASTL